MNNDFKYNIINPHKLDELIAIPVLGMNYRELLDKVVTQDRIEIRHPLKDHVVYGYGCEGYDDLVSVYISRDYKKCPWAFMKLSLIDAPSTQSFREILGIPLDTPIIFENQTIKLRRRFPGIFDYTFGDLINEVTQALKELQFNEGNFSPIANRILPKQFEGSYLTVKDGVITTSVFPLPDGDYAVVPLSRTKDI